MTPTLYQCSTRKIFYFVKDEITCRLELQLFIYLFFQETRFGFQWHYYYTRLYSFLLPSAARKTFKIYYIFINKKQYCLMINFLEQQEIIGHGNLVTADVLAVLS